MLSRNQFCDVIKFIQDIEARDVQFHEDIQKFAGDKDFTGFCSNTSSRVLGWLQEAMHDDDEYGGVISWWLYDCPEAGKCKDDDSCTVWLKDSKEKYIIRTPEQLYDYLLSIMSAPDDEVMQYAFDKQTEGVKFAIHQIDQLEQTNTSTGNKGYEERNALFHLIRNKIRDEYMLGTGSDDPASEYPIRSISLITKGAKDE